MRRLFAAALLCLVSAGSEAKQSPYPPVTQFAGDRYAAQAQVSDVLRAVKAKRQKARAPLPHKGRVKRWHGPVPFPAPRPLAEPGAVEPLSVAGGAWREAGRAVGPRPRAWCGWWLGHHLGMPHRELWLARNWARVGSSAGGPRVGAVVVWPHHVGIITGRQNGLWVVKSGNDRNAVRERPRSVAGAIAFRLPSS